MIGVDVVAGLIGALAGAAVTILAGRALGRRSEPQRAPQAHDVQDGEPAVRLVRVLPFPAFLADPRGRVRVFNAAAGELFGVDPERAVGRALIEVIPSVLLERMLHAALLGETRTRDVAFGSGARERFVAVTVQPYEGGAMAIATDRTALIAAERVRHEFISDVSHELRTPLSAMKLMLETVLLADDDAEARALFLPQIADEVERMVRLVEDLLELARSESGTVPLRRERFDLGEIATSALNTFTQRADALEVELDLDAPERVEVEADRGRLIQVAMNLVDNALRHTPALGKVTVEVTRAGEHALLIVRDTGAGIPYADLPRIFERFYVVDRSRSRERGGTGLGLSIARNLVEAHGGTLTAESIYGHGATFTMRLPSGGAAEPSIKAP
ncbi:MAG TPA: ATP-binding protein [Candidatus Sulfotelmatobacter sp.]|nr:ATP-binding protein [Candidatus Sulfotelmatobacter sp.]